MIQQCNDCKESGENSFSWLLYKKSSKGPPKITDTFKKPYREKIVSIDKTTQEKSQLEVGVSVNEMPRSTIKSPPTPHPQPHNPLRECPSHTFPKFREPPKQRRQDELDSCDKMSRSSDSEITFQKIHLVEEEDVICTHMSIDKRIEKPTSPEETQTSTIVSDDLRTKLVQKCVEMEVAIKHLQEKLASKMDRLDELYYGEFGSDHNSVPIEDGPEKECKPYSVIRMPEKQDHKGRNKLLNSKDEKRRRKHKKAEKRKQKKIQRTLEHIYLDKDVTDCTLSNETENREAKFQTPITILKNQIQTTDVKPLKTSGKYSITPISPALSNNDSINTVTHGYLLYSSVPSPVPSPSQSLLHGTPPPQRKGDMLEKYRRMIQSIDTELW